MSLDLFADAMDIVSEDTASHTLAECVAWEAQRCSLVRVIGPNLTLPAVIHQMVGSRTAWDAVAEFCEEVMGQKEAAERAREADPLADTIRRRRGGRRRRWWHRRLLAP
ncbi:hypothetical protein ACJJTC_013082 [Scirpophaga incertulas]